MKTQQGIQMQYFEIESTDGEFFVVEALDLDGALDQMAGMGVQVALAVHLGDTEPQPQ
jgi:hypothetical protein